MSDRTSGSDGATFQLTIGDASSKSIYQLAQEQLATEAVLFLEKADTISVVMAPEAGVLEIKRDYDWCTSFLVSAADDRVVELAWVGVVTKLLLKSQTGSIVVRFIVTTQ